MTFNQIRRRIIFIIITFFIISMLATYNNRKLAEYEDQAELLEQLQQELDNTQAHTSTLYDIIEQTELVVPIAEQSTIESVKSGLKLRLTSYHPNDKTGSGTCTGSGKCIDDFTVNSKGWYLYKGKLVLAGATNECLRANNGNGKGCSKYNVRKDDITYFNYYDEVVITIDGVDYDGIILDSCGESMKKYIIDLFVKDKASIVDMKVEVE